MQLAVALYNNNVDDEDELEFRKGDILTVLIENPNGFDGWWLCKHKDKCGLCPGNRLKLIQNTPSFLQKPNDFEQSYSRLSTASVSLNITKMSIDS
jgi:enhancer-of-filamentation protein 1